MLLVLNDADADGDGDDDDATGDDEVGAMVAAQ